MTAAIRSATLVALCSLLLCSCGKKESLRKETCPVTSQVYVDGEPAAQLQVYCHNVLGIDAEYPTVSSALTEEEGMFEISTYETGDGVPEGEYVLTFEWKGYDAFSGSYDGRDKLDGRYNNPETSGIRFKVEEGEPKNLGRIDLSTK